MLAKLTSLSTIGISAQLIEVEVDLHRGMPSFTVVGLGDAAVQESRERVRSAVKNSDYRFPMERITVSLAPADLRKTGPAFDLPIALGILSATGVLPELPSDAVFVGELALDGSLRSTQGILPMALAAESLGIKQMFVPVHNAAEAALADNVKVFAIKNLRELVGHLLGTEPLTPTPTVDFADYLDDSEQAPDFAGVRGQEQAKRALEIAAAGAHNLLMCGAPGAGKTLMANALRGILPPLQKDEAMQVAQVYSVAGMLDNSKPLSALRPFRAVHHTASAVAVVGGGARPKPGEITLAHKGILFLDELPEFPTQTLEVLRQPLEDRKVTISRAQGNLELPADFTLIAAMNPCPCGYHNVPDTERSCRCSDTQVQRYQRRISGPLLDRFDLYVDIAPVKFDKLSGERDGESSEIISQRVQQARARQAERLANEKINTNSEMNTDQLEAHCKINEQSKALLEQAVHQFQLSARGYHRVLKVARTIADLSADEQIEVQHIAEALQYRPKVQQD